MTRQAKRYLINEIFYSLQGEGGRAGTANVFVRFAKCNLACNVEEHGFDCDTDFEHGDWYTQASLLEAVAPLADRCRWVLFTGGEPALQLDQTLVDACNQRDWLVAIETNGTRPLPDGIAWTCVSPKPGAEVVIGLCSEVKIVLASGQQPPPPDQLPSAFDYLISPAFKGDEPDPDAIAWCITLALENPLWRLSVQTHKWLGIR
jgi:organic radical activating enzyme